MWLGRLRLTTQLTTLVIAATFISLLVVVLLLLSRAQTIIEDAIIERNVQVLQTAARQLARPARDSDIMAAREVMAPVPSPGSIRRISLYSATGLFLDEEISSDMQIKQGGGDEELAKRAIASGQIVEQHAPGLITLVAPVRDQSRAVGAIVMELPTDDIEQDLLNLRRMALLIALPIVITMALVAWGIARYTVRPIQILTTAATAFGRGELSGEIAIRRGGELGLLAQEFQRMAHDLHESRSEIETQNHTLEQRVEQRTADLQKTLAELQDSIDAREQLSATVRELSSPVVPVLDGILVMPLIGAIDNERADLLLSSLLSAIEKERASYVIIDVTGVPLIDTHVAKTLLQAARAATLLGTQPVLVGLRPELAQTIVGLGVDFSSLITRTDLQSGVGYALDSLQQKRKTRTNR